MELVSALCAGALSALRQARGGAPRGGARAGVQRADVPTRLRRGGGGSSAGDSRGPGVRANAGAVRYAGYESRRRGKAARAGVGQRERRRRAGRCRDDGATSLPVCVPTARAAGAHGRLLVSPGRVRRVRHHHQQTAHAGARARVRRRHGGMPCRLRCAAAAWRAGHAHRHGVSRQDHCVRVVSPRCVARRRRFGGQWS